MPISLRGGVRAPIVQQPIASIHPVTQVVFIDSRTPDIADLMANLQPGVAAYVLDPNADGLAQIAGILQSHHYTGLAAIDLVGHGSIGEIDLGSSALNEGALADHAVALGEIGQALAPGGDLALFGCNTGSGASSTQFIADLSHFAGGADVFAATHPVGGAADGGSFVLDASSGSAHVAAPSPITSAGIANFSGLLTAAPIAEIGVISTGGGNDNMLEFTRDNGTEPSSSTVKVFTENSHEPGVLDNNTSLVAVDPLHNKYFLVVSNVGEQKIFEGNLSQDFNNPNSTHNLTLVYSSAVSHEITGLELDPTTQTLYFTEFNFLDKVDYSTNAFTLTNIVTAPDQGPGSPTFLNGLTIDFTHHTAYFDFNTSSSTFTTHGGVSTTFTNKLYKADTTQVNGTTVTQLPLNANQSGAPGVPGEIIGVAFDASSGNLFIASDPENGGHSGVFEYALIGNAAGDVTKVWDQSVNGPGGVIDGIQVDAHGNYYVTIGHDGSDVTATDPVDGVYVGNLSDTGQAPTQVLSIPPGPNADTTANEDPQGLTVDLAPTLTNVTGANPTAQQGGAAVTVLSGQPTINDLDAPLGEIPLATVTVANFQAGDVLAANTAGTAITASFNGATGVLTLSGADTFADYQKVLASVTFKDTGTDNVDVGFHPTRTIDFVVNDGLVNSGTGTATVTINRPPTTVVESASLLESGSASGTAGTVGTGALKGDGDLDGDAITIDTLAGSGANLGVSFAGTFGHLTLNADGSYSYSADNTAAINAAPGGSHPVDTFSYDVTDGDGGHTAATLKFTIDRPPVTVAQNDTAQAGQILGATAGTGGTGALSGDSDPDGDALTVVSYSDIANGTQTAGNTLTGTFGDLTINADGSFTYNANNAAAETNHATDVFTVTVSDGQTTTNETLTITLNRPPTTVPATNIVNAGSSVNATAGTGVLAGDSDPDNDVLAVQNPGVATGIYGSLTFAADGSYTYNANNAAAIAAAGPNPQDIFSLNVIDGHGGLTSETLTIDVERPPTVTGQTGQVVEGATLTQASAANGALKGDTDPDTESLSITGVKDASSGTGSVGVALAGLYGSLTIAADGTYSYAATNTGAINAAAGGSHPQDVFTLTVSNQDGPSATETITFTVDRPPATVAQGGEITAGQTLSGTAGTGGTGALAGDSDPDGDALSIVSFKQGATTKTAGQTLTGTFGDLTVNADGSYSYNANNAASETNHAKDIFTVTVTDGQTTTNETLTVTLNRPPVGVTDNYTVNENGSLHVGAAQGVLANDTDPDNDTLTSSTLFAAPTAHGTVTLNNDGSFIYTPNPGFFGSDSFTYKPSDGLAQGGTTTVNITVQGGPQVTPHSVPDVETQTVTGTAGTGGTGALSGDTDPQGGSLSVTQVQGTNTVAAGAADQGTYGELTVNADGSFSYTADQTAAINAAATGSHPTDVFNVTVKSSEGLTSVETFTVVIDRPPPASNQIGGANEGQTIGGGLNESPDPDGDAVTVSAVDGSAANVGKSTAGTFGHLTLNANETLSYSADNLAAINAAPTGSHPVDTFTYTLSDGHGGSNSATIDISIDRPPVGVNDSYGTALNTALHVAAAGVLTNDSDPDGDPITAQLVAGPTHASSFTLNADGSFDYTPNAGFFGKDTFTYKDSDGSLTGNTVTVTINVNASPVITGTKAGQKDDDQHTVDPFSAVTVTDPNGAGTIETVKVTLDTASKGTFTAASLAATGFTHNLGNPAEYDFTGTPAQVTAALEALAFAPTPHDVPPGQTETTDFTIFVDNGLAPPATDSVTTVITTDLNDPPTAIDHNVAVMEEHAYSANILTGDFDVDKGDSIHLIGVGVGAGPIQAIGGRGLTLVGTYGTLTISSNGAYTYRVTSDSLTDDYHTHTDSFSYQIGDTHGAATTAHLTFTIGSDDDAETGVISFQGPGGPQTITGGSNGHFLVGGPGSTTFLYNSVTESTNITPDFIGNFDPAKGDVIDLSTLDAIPATPGHDHFHVVSAFDGHAGELVIQGPDSSGYWHLLGDTTGQGTATFVIAFHLIGPMDNTHIHL